MFDPVRSEAMPCKPMLQGWGVSVLLHALLVGVAITTSPQMTMVIEKQPFKWDVALVERVRDVTSPVTPVAPPSVQPPKTVHAQPAPPVAPPTDMVMTSVASRQSVQMIHPVIELPTPVEPVQESVQVQPKPVEQQEVKQEEIKEAEVKEPEPVREVVREVAPVIEPVAPTYAYQAPAPVASHHPTEPSSEPVAVASASAASLPEPTAPPVPTSAALASEPVAATLAPVAHEAVPSVPVVARAPAVSASEPEQAQPVSSSVVEASVVAASSEPVAAAPAPVVTQEPPPVVAAMPAPRPVTKADYAWLAESLGRRIAALTRYPSSARLNGWEGRVVLKAIIRADGHLLHVTVHRSSGHEALDRAALETIKLACPLHMKHALNSAEVAVYVPIVYSLAG